MKEKKVNIIKYVVIIILTFMIAVGSTIFFIQKFPNLFKKTITKIEKDVTVNENGIADAVEKVYDSVVVVSNYKRNSLYGSGSGFIYKVKGNNTYIITNHHVVESGTSFKVTYTNGDVEDATLVGSDEYSDIAVLKVKTKEGFKAVNIGSTEKIRVGDTTFTIGAPLDNTYSWTVTRGILSGKERLVEVSLSNSNQSDYIMNVLQTDSAVNSGNSGGPLSNSNGEVIGVVNAKISSTGVEGIGFAIPIEVAVEKSEQIINGKSSSYPYLGISMLDVSSMYNNPNYRNYISSNTESGVMVIDVEKSSAAANAGIKSNDIIVKINNTKIENVAYLRYELYKHSINDVIKITVIRDGKEKTIKVKLTSNEKK